MARLLDFEGQLGAPSLRELAEPNYEFLSGVDTVPCPVSAPMEQIQAVPSTHTKG